MRPSEIVTDLGDGLDGSDLALVCLPSLAHEPVIVALADAGVRCPIVLNPGHTCGALHAAAVFSDSRSRATTTR